MEIFKGLQNSSENLIETLENFEKALREENLLSSKLEKDIRKAKYLLRITEGVFLFAFGFTGIVFLLTLGFFFFQPDYMDKVVVPLMASLLLFPVLMYLETKTLKSLFALRRKIEQTLIGGGENEL